MPSFKILQKRLNKKRKEEKETKKTVEQLPLEECVFEKLDNNTYKIKKK